MPPGRRYSVATESSAVYFCGGGGRGFPVLTLTLRRPWVTISTTMSLPLLQLFTGCTPHVPIAAHSYGSPVYNYRQQKITRNRWPATYRRMLRHAPASSTSKKSIAPPTPTSPSSLPTQPVNLMNDVASFSVREGGFGRTGLGCLI